jgi:hypothetical protein
MRPRLLPIVSALLLLAVPASCGDENKEAASTRKATTTSSTESTTSTTAAVAATSTTVAGAVPRAGVATTTPRGPVPAGSTSPGGGAKGGPAPAVAGKYRYKQSGKTTIGNSSSPVAPEGTLVVDAAKPDGTQVFHRVADPDRASTDTTFAFRSDGVFIKSTTQRQGSGFQSVTFTCNFNPPLPAPPWPPTVGATFAGKADCGSFTTDVKGKVDGTRKVALDGAQVDVFVASISIVTHGQLESTGTSVQWFAPSLRLIVHSEDHTKGAYGPFGFSSDVTSDLVSGKPA